MNVFADLARPVINRPGMPTQAAKDALEAAAARRRDHVQPRRKPNIEHPELQNPWGLSPQQAALLQHMVDGYANKEIANLMCLAVKTIEVHRSRMLAKMGVENSIRAAVLWDRYIREAKLARMHKFLPETYA